MDEKRKPCECGCGEVPKKATSRFLPGHNIRAKFKDHPEQDQQYAEWKDRERFGEQ